MNKIYNFRKNCFSFFCILSVLILHKRFEKQYPPQCARKITGLVYYCGQVILRLLDEQISYEGFNRSVIYWASIPHRFRLTSFDRSQF